MKNKTKVKMNFDDSENASWSKGETGYIDGYVRGANDRPYVAVVINKKIVLAMVHQLEVINHE